VTSHPPACGDRRVRQKASDSRGPDDERHAVAAGHLHVVLREVWLVPPPRQPSDVGAGRRIAVEVEAPATLGECGNGSEREDQQGPSRTPTVTSMRQGQSRHVFLPLTGPWRGKNGDLDTRALRLVRDPIYEVGACSSSGGRLSRSLDLIRGFCDPASRRVCLFQKGTVATHLETECSFRAPAPSRSTTGEAAKLTSDLVCPAERSMSSRTDVGWRDAELYSPVTEQRCGSSGARRLDPDARRVVEPRARRGARLARARWWTSTSRPRIFPDPANHDSI